MGISIIDTPGIVKLKLDFYVRKRHKVKHLKVKKKMNLKEQVIIVIK